MTGRRILFIGATSTIVRHIALQLVKANDVVCLAARNMTEVERIADELRKNAQAHTVFTQKFDASDFDNHKNFVEEAHQKLGKFDIVVVGTGELGNQMEARQSVPRIKAIIDSNYVGIATALSIVANFMEEQKSGCICVLSSVAGDRGRQSNYIYGSAKSGMASFLQGLRNRLTRFGVTVITIKLGFIDTKMVQGKKGMFLVAAPEAAAEFVVRKIRTGADVVYFPAFWRFIMLIIMHIPEVIFKRLSL